jgi:hypothetical protein
LARTTRTQRSAMGGQHIDRWPSPVCGLEKPALCGT